jgi:sodium pump decarboxylase gamma subunit
MIFEGIQIMLIGMGVVFGFLLILVSMMTISTRFFARFAHLFPDTETKNIDDSNNTTHHDDVALVLAIAHNFAQNNGTRR